MSEFLALTTRNIKIFLRDKTAVFFSFLSVIILLGLYILFLGNQFKMEGLNDLFTDQEQNFFVYSQMIPGLIVINTLTISLGNLGNVINDLEYKIMDGFMVTPVKRFKVIFAYYSSSLLITIALSWAMLLAAWGLLGITSGIFFNPSIILNAALVIVLCSFISSAFMVLLTAFIKSINAFGAVAGVFGTVIGFTSGIYMPLAILPQAMNYVSSLIPFTHMTILLKQIMFVQAYEILETKLPAEGLAQINKYY